jgi:hypothetical protein
MLDNMDKPKLAKPSPFTAKRAHVRDIEAARAAGPHAGLTGEAFHVMPGFC